MSDAKVVGVIGQAYEDRTTGKTGVLESRDDKCKTLMLIGEDGKGFNVSYSSFKSKWRKCAEEEKETIQDEVKEEVVVKNVPKAVKKDVETAVDDDGCYHISTQGFEVLYIKPYKDGTYFVSCLPDIYIDSVELRPYTSNFKCVFTKTGRDVSFKVVKMAIEELLNMLYDAVAGINLYGYIVE